MRPLTGPLLNGVVYACSRMRVKENRRQAEGTEGTRDRASVARNRNAQDLWSAPLAPELAVEAVEGKLGELAGPLSVRPVSGCIWIAAITGHNPQARRMPRLVSSAPPLPYFLRK